MLIRTSRDHRLSRRRLLRHAGLAALLAPVLRRRDAQGAVTSPRRVILIYSPNGPLLAGSLATGSETSFVLHDWWKPLAEHMAEGIFMSHMCPSGAGVVDGNGHGLGGQMFSGHGADGFVVRGETIDQTIGKALLAEGRHGFRRSVVWGLSNATNVAGGGFLSGPRQHLQAVVNPTQAYQDLFSDFMPEAAGAAAAARAAAVTARKKSALQLVIDDCVALRDTLGAEGMRLLDEHCTTMRTVQAGLAETLGVGQCRKPADPMGLPYQAENIESNMSKFIDLIAATLVCERTHVIAFQYGGQGAGLRLPSKYGVGGEFHGLTHSSEPEASKHRKLGVFQSFLSTQLSRLVKTLKSTNDAHGKPLLDSTLVVCASELGNFLPAHAPGNDTSHPGSNVPIMVFGSGQGTFKTGRYVRGKSPERTRDVYDKSPATVAAGAETARLMISVKQYMGLRGPEGSTLGNTKVVGGLDWLYA